MRISTTQIFRKQTKHFGKKAELSMPKPKKGIYLRLDQDLLDWLKRQGPGYQTRINAILRTYMDMHNSGY